MQKVVRSFIFERLLTQVLLFPAKCDRFFWELSWFEGNKNGLSQKTGVFQDSVSAGP